MRFSFVEIAFRCTLSSHLILFDLLSKVSAKEPSCSCSNIKGLFLLPFYSGSSLIATVSEGVINGTRTGYPGEIEKIAEFQKNRKYPCIIKI